MTAVKMSLSSRCCEPRWRLDYSTKCGVLASGANAFEIGTHCAICYDAGRMELKKTGRTGFTFWRCLKKTGFYHRQPVFICSECNENPSTFWFDKNCRFTRFSALLPLPPGKTDLVISEQTAVNMMVLTEPSARGVVCANVACGASEMQNSDDKFLCCSRCLRAHRRNVYYCREACQRQHYPLHAPLCREVDAAAAAATATEAEKK